jgi:hypothetical protein
MSTLVGLLYWLEAAGGALGAHRLGQSLQVGTLGESTLIRRALIERILYSHASVANLTAHYRSSAWCGAEWALSRTLWRARPETDRQLNWPRRRSHNLEPIIGLDWQSGHR